MGGDRVPQRPLALLPSKVRRLCYWRSRFLRSLGSVKSFWWALRRGRVPGDLVRGGGGGCCSCLLREFWRRLVGGFAVVAY